MIKKANKPCDTEDNFRTIAMQWTYLMHKEYLKSIIEINIPLGRKANININDSEAAKKLFKIKTTSAEGLDTLICFICYNVFSKEEIKYYSDTLNRINKFPVTSQGSARPPEKKQQRSFGVTSAMSTGLFLTAYSRDKEIGNSIIR